MKKLSSDEIRDIWLNFFKEHGHYIEPSASLIPFNDPSLLWINAGVSALKKYFDGTLAPRHKRIVNAQKCIRTNDIDNVGYTSRHHTFFEMLGNFSIGDYFREEVIPWAYELFTSEKYFNLDKERLFITYYPDDKDTYNLWVKCGIDPKNMIPSKSNFWEIGQGPCGPDTEINYDKGSKYDPNNLGTKLLTDDIENDRYIELWNIVFSMYNSEPNKKRNEYKLLPQKNIDTGAGLERISCIMQECETNFETDLFLPYIKDIEKKSNVKYEDNKTAYRVIADHIRSLTFALADGASFSNDGRGYVLKRLVRRASRYALKLGLKTNSLCDLVPLVTNNMSHFYPYLKEHQERTMKMIKNEEEKFSATLKTGEKLLVNYLEKDGDILKAESIFKLSDTYGFPFELTKEVAKSYNKDVDEEGFKILLEKSKELARNNRNNKASFNLQSQDLIEFKDKSTFIYEDKDITSKIIGLFIDGKKVNQIDDEGDVIFEKTNFYAEMGGEVADVGIIKNKDTEAEVLSVIKANHGQHLLHVKVLYGKINNGDNFKQLPDYNKRTYIRKNHSATHLLQSALNEILSNDISQQGAYYDSEGLRFDFNFDRKITQDEINQLEEKVNEKIKDALDVSCKIMKKEEAFKIPGLIHLFNEKYGDEVRVVSMGKYSIELCGGLHVNNTSDINLFVIKSESSISSGIRRIEATTSTHAYEYLKDKQRMLNDFASLLKVNSDKSVKEKINSILETNNNLNSTIKYLQEEVTNYIFNNIENNIEELNNKKILFLKSDNLNHDQLDSLGHKIIDKYKDILVFIVSSNNDKYDLMTATNIESLKAGQVMKELSSLLNGSGGGRNDVAFGGTNNIDNLNSAKNILKEIINV